jgi:hypothetical protein
VGNIGLTQIKIKFVGQLLCTHDRLLCTHDGLLCTHDKFLCTHDRLLCSHDRLPNSIWIRSVVSETKHSNSHDRQDPHASIVVGLNNPRPVEFITTFRQFKAYSVHCKESNGILPLINRRCIRNYSQYSSNDVVWQFLFLMYEGWSKISGTEFIVGNESFYKLLEVISFKVRPSRLYTVIPTILSRFNSCLVGLFGNGLQLRI